MRVIKKGPSPDDIPWQGLCNYCNSVIEASRSEVKIAYDQYEFGKAHCPVCTCEMIFYPIKRTIKNER